MLRGPGALLARRVFDFVQTRRRPYRSGCLIPRSPRPVKDPGWKNSGRDRLLLLLRENAGAVSGATWDAPCTLFIVVILAWTNMIVKGPAAELFRALRQSAGKQCTNRHSLGRRLVRRVQY